MTTRKCFAVVALTALLLTSGSAAPAAGGNKILVGILPVYDTSGESFGDEFSRNVTFIIFRELQASSNIEPVLLMPGGVYTPTADDWIQEYGRSANVDEVVVLNFESDRNRRGPTTLN
jgi:hypothetical protein